MDKLTIERELIDRLLTAMKPLYTKGLINDEGQISRRDGVYNPFAARDPEWFERDEKKLIKQFFEHELNYFRGSPVFWLDEGNVWHVITQEYKTLVAIINAVYRKSQKVL